MSHSREGAASPARMSVSLTAQRDGAVLELLPPSGVDAKIPLSLSQLTELIQALGRARADLLESVPVPSIEGAPIAPVYKTRWAVQPEALTEGSVIAFQHPAFGPVAFVLQRSDAERVVRTLNTHLAMVHSAEQSSSRPS